MNLDTKKALFVLLYRMASSDNTLHPNERRFIQEIMLQFPEVDISTLSEDIVLPEDEQSRMNLLYYLYFLMKADGKIKFQETELVYKFGVDLGCRPEMMDKLTKLFIKYQDQEIPEEEMLEIIKSYLN